MEIESPRSSPETKNTARVAPDAEREIILQETKGLLSDLRIDVTRIKQREREYYDSVLNSPDPHVRASLASAPLIQGNTFALESIPKLLADPSPIVRAALAGNWWLELRDPTLLPKLLEDEDPSVRLAITQRPPHYLRRYGENFVKKLLEDKSPAVRAEMAQIWTPYLGGASSARKLLSDPSPEVRRAISRNKSSWMLRIFY